MLYTMLPTHDLPKAKLVRQKQHPQAGGLLSFLNFETCETHHGRLCGWEPLQTCLNQGLYMNKPAEPLQIST